MTDAPHSDAAREAVHYRTCPLCEATCGLEIHTRGREVVDIRGDNDDVFSHGHICPKGYALKEFDADPDRVRSPLIRETGGFREASWDEAFERIETGIGPFLKQGRQRIGLYMGNPSASVLSLNLYITQMAKALASTNVFTASTADQMPKQVSCGLLFGTAVSIPVPDVDHTEFMLILGANPLESMGSIMTAPGIEKRLRGIQKRGGRIVVVDPKRTRTARLADQHLPIRPGTDALLLAALAQVLFEEDRVVLYRLADHVSGLAELETALHDFRPEVVTHACGISAQAIRDLARALANATRAAVYGRIGTCTQEFGVLSSWLIDVLNVLTGNLDRAGGALFTRAATGSIHTYGRPGRGKGVRFGRWKSRVREAPEIYGELPVACLAEEMDTPGEGQIRAFITTAGNPVLSAPRGDRLARALEGLDFMLSLDVYVNETTRHADVILPGISPLEESHYDSLLYQFAVRNVANYSPAIFEPPPGQQPEWRTLVRLTGLLMGQGPKVDVDALDDELMRARIAFALRSPTSPILDLGIDPIMKSLEPRRGPERILDFMLRSGPYGDAFEEGTEGLSLDLLKRHPHGIDLGPLESRIPEVLRTPSGSIELAHPILLDDLTRLAARLNRAPEDIVLVGRRSIRSKNSWLHNLPVLVKGKNRCTLEINPLDADRLGLGNGDIARVSTGKASIRIPVAVTDAIMPGVVSIPHGWGHSEPESRLGVAAQHAGVNSNLLASEDTIEPLSGNAILNGIPVQVEAER